MDSSMRQAQILLLLVIATAAFGQTKNGFNLDGALVPEEEIHSGGPPRDGIPAIDKPRFVSAEKADYIQADGRVLGITRAGVSKAYPVAIMNWHEIVNDTIGDEPVVVTYCPLCGTGIAYHARVGGQVLDFGVSGLLYNSDMLLYDRQTESLWSQIGRQAISGPLKGTELQPVPLMHTRWSDWQQRYPATQVLSTDTGHDRDYTRNAYAGYEKTRELWFSVRALDRRYHTKEPVLGIEVDGQFKAYPFVELEKAGTEIKDALAGQHLVVKYDSRHHTAVAVDVHGNTLPGVIAFWFAWYAFHPDTEVYSAE